MRNALLAVLLVVGLAVAPAAAVAQADRTPTDTTDATDTTGATHATDTTDATDATDECAFPVTETDATDTAVTVEEEPETVVTLNPSAAQTMWEIGAEEKVIGVTKHAMNLEGANSRTNISRSGETIDPETVVELDPDLVLAPSSQIVSEELIEVLREAGLTVYNFPSATSIDDVRAHTRLTGRLAGACDGAAETVEWMDSEIETVESAVEGESIPDVLYVFFGFTAGEETFIHELLETAGGTNVAAEVGVEEYRQLSEETVLEEDPDWIVLNSDSPEVPDSEAYATTTAVREDQVVVVNINYLNRPAPRVVHGIAAMAEAFHPEAYAAAVAEREASSPTGSTNSTASTPTTESTAPGSTSNGSSGTAADGEDQTGFGAGLALLALLAATLLARRTDGSG